MPIMCLKTRAEVEREATVSPLLVGNENEVTVVPCLLALGKESPAGAEVIRLSFQEIIIHVGKS